MPHPILYEINTRCWLRELSDRLGKPITLATVPDEEFAQWQALGFTHIWLMGVWKCGPRARKPAQEEPGLQRAYDEALPGWRKEDVAGSPYSIADYAVARALGGEAGLREFRIKLQRAGLKLILDFVPNHLGIDHPWLRERPELFVQSPTPAQGTFLQPTPKGERWIAHGKDPYFPHWTDVAQLDYRRPETRRAMKATLLDIATRCDGVRCDMAMLVLNDVFAKTWTHLPTGGPPPKSEFWAEAIPAVRETRPDFTFLAEVYWRLEAGLQSLGFDYTYDKQLYDELIWQNPLGVQQRLLEASPGFVSACAHFLENHDEPRVASKLALPEHRAAALVMLGLPGMRFLHEGQLTGARIKTPVQLGRRRVETPQADVLEMYQTLLSTLRRTAVGRSHAEILAPREAWSGNSSSQYFVLVQWWTRPDQFDLVVINLAPHRSQCYAPLRRTGLAAHNWSMRDLLGTESYERFGSDLERQGLYLDLAPHGAQIFRFAPIA